MTEAPVEEATEVPAERVSAGAVARGSVWAMLGLVLSAVLQLGYNVLLARAYGAEATGVFAFGLSFTGVAAVICLLGARETILKFGASYLGVGDDARTRGVVWYALAVAAAGGLALTAALWVGADWVGEAADKPEAVRALRIMALSILPVALVTVMAGGLQAARRLDLYTLLRDVSRAATVVAALGLAAALSLPFETFLMLYVGASALVLVVGTVLVARHLPVFRGPRPVFQWRTWTAFGLTVVLLDVFRPLSAWADTLVLGFFVDSADLGVYFVALRISLLITIALGGFSAMLAPLAADAWNRNDLAGLRRVFALTTRWTWILVLPVFVATLLLSDELMRVFGEDFATAEGALVLLIVVVGRVVNSLTGSVGRILMMTGHQRVELLDTVLMITGLVLGFWLLVPRYGLIGGAIVNATMISGMNLVKLGQVWHYLRVQPYDRTFLPLLGAAVVALGAGWGVHELLPQSVVVRFVGVSLVVAVAYGAVVAAVGLDADDRELLAMVRRRLGGGRARG